MMGRLIVDAATSLDGFWADARGCSVAPGGATSDAYGAIVMSRASLESVPGWDYAAQAPVFVVGDDMAVAGAHAHHIQFIDSYAAAFRAAKAAAGDKAVLVLGEAGALRAAMRSGAADDIWLRVISRTLGGGSPLFEEGTPVEDYFVSEMETTPDTVHMHLERRLEA